MTASGNQPGPGITLASLAGAAWRNKLTLIVSATVFVLLGGFYAFGVATSKYATGTTLALEIRGEQLIDIEKVISGVSSDQEAINTELEIIKSRGLLEKLVAELNLTDDPEFNTTLRPERTFSPGKLKALIGAAFAAVFSPDREGNQQQFEPISPERRIMIDTVDALRENIETEHLRDTYILRIRATAGSEKKAALLANTLADLYIRDQIEQKQNATENAVSWLAGRVSELDAELEEKQNRAEAMRAEMSLSDSDALEITNQRTRNLRDRLNDALDGLESLMRRKSILEAPATDRAVLAQDLDDLILNRILSSGAPMSPQQITQFDNRVAILRNSIDREISQARLQVDALQPSLERAEAETALQSEKLIELQQLQRDLASTQTLHETFLTRLKEATVQRGLQQADSRVLSVATPGELVAPRRARIVMLSGILGLLFGAALVAIRQFSNDGIRTDDELEALTGLPVIGQIPKMPLKGRGDLLPYLLDQPTSASAEAIRNLRTSLLLSNVDNPPHVILSTSARPAEGKTTQSVALAQHICQLGKKVLLIEGDLRRLTFQDYFAFGEKPLGLSDVLAGLARIDEVIQQDPVTGINVLPAGKANGGNPADLFSSDLFRTLVAQLRQTFHFIIIDTPPVLVVPDAMVIGQLVDAIVLSVAWDSTSRSEIIQALKQLENVHLRPVGVVLSRIDPKRMEKYGYHGYYSNYHSAYHEN